MKAASGRRRPHRTGRLGLQRQTVGGDQRHDQAGHRGQRHEIVARQDALDPGQGLRAVGVLQNAASRKTRFAPQRIERDRMRRYRRACRSNGCPDEASPYPQFLWIRRAASAGGRPCAACSPDWSFLNNPGQSRSWPAGLISSSTIMGTGATPSPSTSRNSAWAKPSSPRLAVRTGPAAAGRDAGHPGAGRDAARRRRPESRLASAHHLSGHGHHHADRPPAQRGQGLGPEPGRRPLPDQARQPGRAGRHAGVAVAPPAGRAVARSRARRRRGASIRRVASCCRRRGSTSTSPTPKAACSAR